ncbi:biquitin domain-containing protein 7SL RNA1-like [Cucurbita maxima]|uniref:Biquitin domain-containing protein 7SL RNA1-like n=1 Tax=Cucurbita maxima TaxID=3661 RepID=A0A6J1IPZ4_CUCMA|nr:biquitin domain-containing protein 7SL RNA1-like [Cucurbita maxima]
MDVLFVPEKGEAFAIEVGFFDTVLEIKEKIQKYHHIPIPKQTLIFNGHVLQDDRDVEFCEILQHSRIQLLVASESQNNSQSQSQPQPQIDPNHSIGRLKQRIHDINSVGPINGIMLQSNASPTELQDQRSLRDSEMSENSEVEVCLRPSPTVSTAALGMTTPPPQPGSSKNKLKVMVQPKFGNSKIPMEVNPTDNVGELKKELQKLQQRLHFHLPPEGFFFIYDRDVMDEDRSFRWHGVAHGDTIEIFNGSVSGGS